MTTRRLVQLIIICTFSWGTYKLQVVRQVSTFDTVCLFGGCIAGGVLTIAWQLHAKGWR